MIVKELFGTQIINASFLFANSNISVKYYSKDFPSVLKFNKEILKIIFPSNFIYFESFAQVTDLKIYKNVKNFQ